jgi:hypothetical protein
MNTSIIELSYVPEPDRESVKRCIEEKKRIGALFIKNPNRLKDYVAWQCKELWLKPIWNVWKDRIRSVCNINYRDFMYIASYTYPAEWLFGRMSWRDFLTSLIEVLNKRCRSNFHLEGISLF